MIERDHGLILRTRPFTETSLIVHWLTAKAGRIHTVARGARRPKSPLRGRLDLFYEAEFSFNRSRRSHLHTLSEVTLVETHAALRQEIAHLQQAAYCAALIEQTTETDTPLPGVFELMSGFLKHLAGNSLQSRNVFAFELKLLNELGLTPDMAKSRLSPTAVKLVEALGSQPWKAIADLKATAGTVTELRRFLHGFLIFHLGKIPKGRPA